VHVHFNNDDDRGFKFASMTKNLKTKNKYNSITVGSLQPITVITLTTRLLKKK